MPIPVFVSEVRLGATDLAGSVADLSVFPTTVYYFYVSEVTTVVNGQSLLRALRNRLSAAFGIEFSCTLNSDLKLQITQDGTGSRDVLLSLRLARGLGLVAPTETSNPVTVTIPPGVDGATAAYRSQWLWCPGVEVSATGPEFFDPATNAGVPSSPGSANRAPDQTASFASNGTQLEAQLNFTAIQPYDSTWPKAGFANKDFVTWWQNGPRLGRRILFWRDRTNIVGNETPTAGDAPPFNYVEYYPAPTLRSRPTITATSGPMLTFWNALLYLWVTEHGEAVYAPGTPPVDQMDSCCAVVDNIAGLRLLDSTQLSWGAKVWVKTKRATYVYDKDATGTDEGNFLVAPSAIGATGRYERQVGGNSFWQSQVTWYIDPAGTNSTPGTDELDGLTSSTPIKSMREWRARIDGAKYNATVTINVLSSSTVDDDSIITGFTTPMGSFGTGEHVALVAAPVPIGSSFTLTSGTAARSGNTRAQVVASGLSDTWTNKGFVTTTTGARLIRNTAKTKHSWIVKDMGSLIAMTGRSTNVAETPVDSPADGASAFVSGDTVEVCSLLRWPGFHTSIDGRARPYCLEFNGSSEYARPVINPGTEITYFVLCSFLGTAYFPASNAKFLTNCCVPNSAIFVSCIPQSCALTGLITITGASIDWHGNENVFQNGAVVASLMDFRTGTMAVFDLPSGGAMIGAVEGANVVIESLVGEGNAYYKAIAASGSTINGSANITGTTSKTNKFNLNGIEYFTAPIADLTSGGGIF